jgi:hypothetical protein
MVKKTYSAPLLKSENVEIGVFGSYGRRLPVIQRPMKKKMWFWWW